MNQVAKQTRTTELKKHVNAIHCTNSLTLVQRKLFNALLFNAYPTIPHKSRFEIKARDLCNLIGYNSNDYGKLKKALLGLITVAIEWNVINFDDGSKKNWKASSVLASAELDSGMCYYEYSSLMRELLYQPEIYGKINMTVMAQFKSGYGLALYENCIRYQQLPQTPWFPIDVFRKLMGVSEVKYGAFKDLKKRVINIAIEEVNQISSLKIVPEVERVNQKVTKIRFKLKKSKRDDKESEGLFGLGDGCKKLLSETFGLSKELIANIIEQYDEGYIQEKIDLIIDSENFKAGSIRGLAGYLIEALRKDFKPSKSSRKIIDDNRAKQKIKAEALQKEDEVKKERYEKYVNNRLTKYLNFLTQAEHELLLREFEKNAVAKDQLLKKWYKEYQFDHPGAKACFFAYLRENRKSEVGQILSFDDFISLSDELAEG